MIRTALPPLQVAKPLAQITAVAPASYDKFGSAVALSGGTCLVGAPLKALAEVPQVGAAYIFVGGGANWSQQAMLTTSGGAAWDEFGYAVAVSGDTAFVGAPRRTVNGEAEAGAVYVFTRAGSAWTQTLELSAADARSGDHFGSSIAVSGDTMLVGAPYRSGGGAAFAFTKEGGAWKQQAAFAAESTYNEFGLSVALSGDTALIGSPAENCTYLYQRSGSDWSRTKMEAPSGAGGFGQAVDLSSDTAIVAAPFGTSSNGNGGMVYVYTRSAEGWLQQGTLSASDGAYDGFGNCVALSGDIVLVARPSVVYVFARSAGVWAPQSRGGSGPAPSGDRYGTAMAMSGDVALIGAPAGSVGDSFECGGAYACRIVGDAAAPLTKVVLTGKPNAAGWFARPVGISFSAVDAGAGVERTFCRLIGWSNWSAFEFPFSTPKEGTNTLEFYSVDWAGITETVKSMKIRVDSVPPTTRATGDYFPTRGQYQRLSCILADKAGSTCTVKLQILKAGRVVQTTPVGTKKPGTVGTRWKATLPRGRYTYRFTAVDITGHRQSSAVAKRLVVR